MTEFLAAFQQTIYRLCAAVMFAFKIPKIMNRISARQTFSTFLLSTIYQMPCFTVIDASGFAGIGLLS